jgi:hypothetical protein
VRAASDGRGTDSPPPGRALLARLEAWAGECDCEYVALAARDGNDAALAFHEDCGLDA